MSDKKPPGKPVEIPGDKPPEIIPYKQPEYPVLPIDPGVIPDENPFELSLCLIVNA